MRAATAMSDINITPFVDVLLVLLIIFMVIAPVPPRALDVAVPAVDHAGAPGTPAPPPVLEVAADHFKLGGELFVSIEDLGRGLTSVYAVRRDRTIVVRADGEVSYGRMVAAMDAARGAGVETVGVMSGRGNGGTTR